MKKGSGFGFRALVVLLAAALLCTAGCSKKAPQAAKKDGFKFAVSTGMAGNTWVSQYVTGITQRFEAYKAQGLVSDYQIVTTNSDVTEQINQCTPLINSGIDCLILWPAKTSGVQPLIELAKEKGVLVIINNDPAAFDGTYCVAGNTVKWMEIQARWLAAELNGKGNIVRIEGAAGNSSNELRVQASDQVLAGTSIRTLASGNGNYSPNVAQELMTTYLSTYGDRIDGVLAQDVMGDGILKAYQNAGVTPKYITGDYVKSYLVSWSKIPALKSCAVTYDAFIGSTALDVAINLLQGKTFKSGVLVPNPADESMVNALIVDPAFVVTREGDRNAPWMQGLNSKAVSLDEALKVLEGRPDTEALDGGMTQEEVAALFN